MTAAATPPTTPPWQLAGWRAADVSVLGDFGLAAADAPTFRLTSGIAVTAAVRAASEDVAQAWAAAVPDGYVGVAAGDQLLLARDPGHLAETKRWLTAAQNRNARSREVYWRRLGAPVCCARAAPPGDALWPLPEGGLLGQGALTLTWFPPCRPDCPSAIAAVARFADLTGAGERLRTAFPVPPPSWLWPTDLPAQVTSYRVQVGRVDVALALESGPLSIQLTPEAVTPRAFKRGAGLALAYRGQLTKAAQALLDAWWHWLTTHVDATLQHMQPPPPVRRHRPTKALPGEPIAPRTTVLGPDEARAMFHVEYEWGEDAPERQVTRVGILYRCNQWCAFCGLAEMDVDLPDGDVRAAIQAGRDAGSRRLILTGGEPTLHKQLPAFIAFAKSIGYEKVTVQSNVVRLADGPLLERLVAAGLDEVQVSLHGADAAFSDWLTQAPGTHARTVAGVTRVLQAGVHVLLNGLVFAPAVRDLNAYVDFCAQHWLPYARHIVLQFRMPSQEFDDVALARRLVPRYRDFVPAVLAATDRAVALGFEAADARQPVTAPSWCVLSDAGVDVTAWLQNGTQVHHAWESDWFTRVAACAACPAARLCPGVRKDHLALFGDDEYHALRLPG